MSELTIGSHSIRRDGDMWCITDLWRAHGAIASRKPKEWLRSADAQRLFEFLSDSLEGGNSHLTKARKTAGGGGDTWAHWQLALAYAKWLSPEFHARVNEIYRAYTAGQLVAPAQGPTLALPSTVPVPARIGDDARASATVRAWCRTASQVTGRTVTSIHGQLRKPWGLASIYRIPLVAYERTLADLQALTVSPTNRRLPASRRQLSLLPGGAR